jgi:hypothetical protein
VAPVLPSTKAFNLVDEEEVDDEDDALIRAKSKKRTKRNDVCGSSSFGARV